VGRAGVLALVAVTASLVPTGARTQTVKETLDATRQARETQRRVLVSGAMVLTEAEAKAFWPLYDDYEKDRRAIDERDDRLVADFVASYASLTDVQARAMLQEALRVDEARLKLRRDFTERMGRALPPRKLVRFFQIENKLDAVVHAEAAQRIPLVP
jgi:hypothetical protein